MSYQLNPVTECLITHFTGIRALTNMYALMFYQTALLTEIGIHHYVCANVLSEPSF